MGTTLSPIMFFIKILRRSFLPVFLLFSGTIRAQQIDILASGRQVSLRGLSVVTNQIVWVSGSAGNVGLSTNGGRIWKWIQVPGYEKTDFRDIEGFSAREALIMGITLPAVILRTTDGGDHWTNVFEDTSKDVFLDAMAFTGNQGISIADPIQHKMYIIITENRGKTWKSIPSSALAGRQIKIDTLDTGEAFFAASGSNIMWRSNSRWAAVTGGKKSNMLLSDNHSYPLLMNQGGETTGANSIALNPADSNEAFIVGGDFSHDTSRYRNALRVRFNPFIQTSPITSPHGYRSCVEYIDKTRLICCGTSGVDISVDGGMNWKLISDKRFHVCSRSKSGKTVFLAGPLGLIGRMNGDPE
jgi:Photosynthesis system II assembly factor YCF48